MQYIIATLLCLSQIVVFPNLSFRWAKEVTLQMVALYALCYLIWNKNKWLASYIAYSTVMFFVQKNFIVNDAGNGTAYNINPIALLNLVNIVLMGCLYIAFQYIKFNKDTVYKSFCFIAVFQSIYVILQKLGFDELFRHLVNGSYYETWPVGTWANEALCSWCIVLCSVFFLNYKELRFKVGYAVCFIALLCTKVTTGIVGFVLGFLFWLWHKNRKLTVLLVVLLTLICVGFYTTGKLNWFLQDTHRFDVWKKAAKLVEKPLTGMGIGSFKQIFPYKALEFAKDGMWAQAHNEYLQVYFEQGIVGLGIILGLIFTTALSYYRRRVGLIPITCLLVSLFISISSFPFHTASGGIVIIALALFDKEKHDVNTNS